MCVATRWWINKARNNDQKLYSLMPSEFKMVTIIIVERKRQVGWGLNWITVAMREKTRGLMARINLGEKNWEGHHATDSVASEWGVELTEGLNLTVATGILWACHGNSPDPSWVGRLGLMMSAREWCTRLRSGAREYRVVHEMGAREYGVVHESSKSGAQEFNKYVQE